jgi:hypothetical protein
MCQQVGSQNLAPGWICCGCRIYNGIQRGECKQCEKAICRADTIAAPVQIGPMVPSREQLDAIVGDLTDLLRVGEHLVSKVETVLQIMPLPDLVKALNEIEMPEDAARRFQDLKTRIPALVEFDLDTLTEAMLPIVKANLTNEPLPN